eukprot:jgi/Undpi1/11482/HiC_scaffold_30.g13779.m1
MAMTRVLVAALFAYLAIASISGNAQPLPPPGDTGLTSYVFSVEVLLDESADPVLLGIRDGQTVAQAAERFCLEHGLDEAMQTVLMPQLIQVLENGIAEAIGDTSRVGGESASLSQAPGRAISAATSDTRVGSSSSFEPLITLGISLDGKEERTFAYYTGQPLLTVPLNINGIETTLKMYEGSGAEGVAYEFCHQEEFAFKGPSLNSCYSQIVEIAIRAITVYNSQKTGEVSRRAGAADPFTFKVPVTLAGLLLHAEYRTSETPAVSALRFCGPNLPAIESALGIDNTEEIAGHDDDVATEEDVAASGGRRGGAAGGGSLAEGRESLKEACAMVVEDAINAVLLGLRERVLEAEIAQANATESLYNDDEWSREQSIAAAVAGEGGLDGVLASVESTTGITDATT